VSLPATGEFTIKGARNAGTKPNPHGGEFDKWYVDLIDPDGKPIRDAQGKTDGAYWQRKSPSEVNEGDVVYGTVSEGEYGLRFKLEQRPDGGSTSTSGGGDYRARGGKSPDQQASIERQVALKILAPTINSEGLSENVKATVLEIESFIQAARGAGDSNAAAASGTQPNPGPPQASETQSTHERIQGLLEEAGVNWFIAQRLKDWALEELEPTKQDEVITALQNPERRENCVEWMKKTYESVKGALPAPKDDGDDIPFARPEYGEVFSERERWSNR
jgi:hypothetical protein